MKVVVVVVVVVVLRTECSIVTPIPGGGVPPAGPGQVVLAAVV